VTDSKVAAAKLVSQGFLRPRSKTNRAYGVAPAGSHETVASDLASVMPKNAVLPNQERRVMHSHHNLVDQQTNHVHHVSARGTGFKEIANFIEEVIRIVA
jgi:hypothetical protein